MDNIRGLFSGSRNNQPTQPQVNENYDFDRFQRSDDGAR
jgi:hypothetical protein